MKIKRCFEKFMKYNTNNELIAEKSNVYEKYYKYLVVNK